MKIIDHDVNYLVLVQLSKELEEEIFQKNSSEEVSKKIFLEEQMKIVDHDVNDLVLVHHVYGHG